MSEYLQPENRTLLESIGLKVIEDLCEEHGIGVVIKDTGNDIHATIEGDEEECCPCSDVALFSGLAKRYISGSLTAYLDERHTDVTIENGYFNVWKDNESACLAKDGKFYHVTTEHQYEDFPTRAAAQLAAVKALQEVAE